MTSDSPRSDPLMDGVGGGAGGDQDPHTLANIFIHGPCCGGPSPSSFHVMSATKIVSTQYNGAMSHYSGGPSYVDVQMCVCRCMCVCVCVPVCLCATPPPQSVPICVCVCVRACMCLSICLCALIRAGACVRAKGEGHVRRAAHTSAKRCRCKGQFCVECCPMPATRLPACPHTQRQYMNVCAGHTCAHTHTHTHKHTRATNTNTHMQAHTCAGVPPPPRPRKRYSRLQLPS